MIYCDVCNRFVLPWTMHHCGVVVRPARQEPGSAPHSVEDFDIALSYGDTRPRPSRKPESRFYVPPWAEKLDE